jgi:hypothetical protein
MISKRLTRPPLFAAINFLSLPRVSQVSTGVHAWNFGSKEVAMKVLLTGIAAISLLKDGHHIVGLDSDLYQGCSYAGGGVIVPISSLNKDIRDVELQDLIGFDACIIWLPYRTIPWQSWGEIMAASPNSALRRGARHLILPHRCRTLNAHAGGTGEAGGTPPWHRAAGQDQIENLKVRLVLHTGAYWLMLKLRDAVPQPQPLATAEFTTLRMRLIKIAARIVETASRVRPAFAAAHPGALFACLARCLKPGAP